MANLCLLLNVVEAVKIETNKKYKLYILTNINSRITIT